MGRDGKGQECEKRHQIPRARRPAICNPMVQAEGVWKGLQACRPARTPNYRWILVFLTEKKRSESVSQEITTFSFLC